MHVLPVFPPRGSSTVGRLTGFWLGCRIHSRNVDSDATQQALRLGRPLWIRDAYRWQNSGTPPFPATTKHVLRLLAVG